MENYKEFLTNILSETNNEVKENILDNYFKIIDNYLKVIFIYKQRKYKHLNELLLFSLYFVLYFCFTRINYRNTIDV